jgi:hypothetical protein
LTPPDPLPELMAEHRRLIDAIEGNERQLLEPRPETFAALAARRWAFARELLLHCAHEQATVLRPLAADPRTHVSAEATRLLAEQDTLIGDFKEHVRRWGAFASADEWPDYVRSALGLMKRVRHCIQAEEGGLYRHLPAQRAHCITEPPAPAQSVVLDARLIGALIFQGRTLP